MSSRTTLLARGKQFFFRVAALGLAICAALAIAEVFLRFVPLPGIGFHTFYYNEVTGGRYYPGTTVVYRNARGDEARRRVNSLGFLDVEHERIKPPGTVRIGFFGDSYTEAQQVRLEDTFFRRVERTLNAAKPASSDGPEYECFSFGMSGYSSLQAYLECRTWMNAFDLDHIVYVFVENDPGDQIREIKRSDAIPAARLESDTLVIDFSFRQRYGYKDSRAHRLLQYVKSHSLVVSTIEGRLKLLRRHGVRVRVTPEDMQMAERARSGEIPHSGTTLSSWPDSLVQATGRTGRLVLERWFNEVAHAGRRMSVLYIPLEREMEKPLKQQDSWAAWLIEICSENGVEFIDPSSRFVEAKRAEKELFYDHLTQKGHEVLANVFVDAIQQR